ncbi:RNA methyltransferase [Candidatus Wolfebacteria bacterium]|nr:RNA methyltransferase [Candidatus Wolfebacteria bacterium]
MVVVLDNIRSLNNVGSIFRTADAAGVEKIYLCGITPEPVDRFNNPRPQLTKVSLGAEKNVVWEKVGRSLGLVRRLKKDGYKILALEQDNKSIKYFKFKKKKSEKIALILGNEVKGISASLLKEADKILEIPMRGKKESLNVSVAFGVVILYLANL